MGCGCRVDVIYGFAYPVQCSWSSNSKIGHGHVVVYGAHKPHDSQMTVLGHLIFSNLPCSAVLVRRNPIKTLLFHLENAILQ
jgi:hypothetical protein